MPSRPAILGAVPRSGGQTEFAVWAPAAERVEVHLVEPRERFVALASDSNGYHTGIVDDVAAGSTYLYRIDGVLERPDPASRHQPHGVHRPSAVVDLRFDWTDGGWRGLPLRDYVLYELHVGTFTPEGTFDAIVPRLDALRELGITAVEIMPVAAFPGDRNWGYDGVYPFAVQDSYGGPDGLHRLVDACHARGLAVVLDVVYNHLGPEGNYLGAFGPYFTDHYRTPWGPAVNFDGAFSDEVRHYFVENAMHWVRDLHIDALRLDAIHGIYDFSARPFLALLQERVAGLAAEQHRHVHLISESDLNDSRVIRPTTEGGYGHAAQWSDDLHHALHVVLTGEQQGYYADFGSLVHLARAMQYGYAYTGQYSVFRRRSHGNDTRGLDGDKFVVFAQNHDQVGNRMRGERLSALVSFESQKLAASVVLLAPSIPLLFMGEEYGETAPFQYFVSHGDPDLVAAVRRGRREEFAAFGWEEEPPDPQDETTFRRSQLHWETRTNGSHAILLQLHTELLTLRRTVAALHDFRRHGCEMQLLEDSRVLCMWRRTDDGEAFVLFVFDKASAEALLKPPPGVWHKRFDTSDPRWHGEGSRAPSQLQGGHVTTVALRRHSCLVYTRA